VSDIRSVTYEGGVAVTASDTADDPAGPFSGLFSGAGGSIKVRTISKDDVTFTNVPAGVVLPIACKRVFVTGTTATNVLGLRTPYISRPIGG
jgi:hypothetical protein